MSWSGTTESSSSQVSFLGSFRTSCLQPCFTRTSSFLQSQVQSFYIFNIKEPPSTITLVNEWIFDSLKAGSQRQISICNNYVDICFNFDWKLLNQPTIWWQPTALWAFPFLRRRSPYGPHSTSCVPDVGKAKQDVQHRRQKTSWFIDNSWIAWEVFARLCLESG